jgi:hypothetical protein
MNSGVGNLATFLSKCKCGVTLMFAPISHCAYLMLFVVVGEVTFETQTLSVHTMSLRESSDIGLGGDICAECRSFVASGTNRLRENPHLDHFLECPIPHHHQDQHIDLGVTDGDDKRFEGECFCLERHAIVVQLQLQGPYPQCRAALTMQICQDPDS